MDAHLFRLFAERAAPLLLNSRIEKIQEFAPAHLAISFYDGSQKRVLYLRFGKKNPFCFIGDKRPAGLPRPSAQIMRLRKYFAGKRIAAVVPQPWSRKLWLMTGGATPDHESRTVWLCLDLANGPQVHFLTPADSPSLESCKWPNAKELNEALAHWQDWPSLTPALRKLLTTLEPAEAAALLADLEIGGGDVFLYANSQGKVEKASAWPLPKDMNLQETASEDILPALLKAGQDIVLQALHDSITKNQQLGANRRIRQLEKTLLKVEEDEKRLLAMLERGKAAQALAAELWQMPKNEKLAEVSLAVNGKEQKIALDKRLTLAQNMERMFHTAKRGKRGLAMLTERRDKLQAELQNAKDDFALPMPGQNNSSGQPVANIFGKHVQGFISSNGYQILRGRDAKGNIAVRRMASGHDLWAHVEEGPGAHVIIKRPHGADEPPLQTLQEAGSLAANKSWLAQAGSASIMLAEARHVKSVRQGPAGKVSIDKIWRMLTVNIDTSLEERLLHQK